MFQSMEPKIIKEEAIERDTGSLIDDPAINNNNNKESAFRIHIRKSIFKFILCYAFAFAVLL